eukprot:14362-Hanusia_phi.AAC.3
MTQRVLKAFSNFDGGEEEGSMPLKEGDVIAVDVSSLLVAGTRSVCNTGDVRQWVVVGQKDRRQGYAR